MNVRILPLDKVLEITATTERDEHVASTVQTEKLKAGGEKKTIRVKRLRCMKKAPIP